MTQGEAKVRSCGIELERSEAGDLLVRLEGQWRSAAGFPDAGEVIGKIESGGPVKRLAFDTSGLTDWDSGLLTFLLALTDHCNREKIEVAREGLPKGVIRLIQLARAVPERKEARKQSKREGPLTIVGSITIEFVRSAGELVAFIGEAFISLTRFLTGRAVFKKRDLAVFIEESGARALPIISLVSLLIGLILAFVGAIQLRVFGAEIYVASLVGVATVRELGAIMTAVVMSGRTGAAFAAQLGTMQVNDEIDALKTMGISPIDFLVLPRMLALTIMMPLLCLYANLMGILGGFLVGVSLLNISPRMYINQTIASIGFNDLVIGVFMSVVFGVLVSLAGCLRGMQCQRSSAGVGAAATSAVVTGIVSIIVATAAITVACEILGI
ncbi:MAG: ABC transporter permease [Planctomycetota bacterium]|jgi:phospholipid/cholesterol/gamma-HCH transport system permease protein